MTTRSELADELASVRKTSRVITWMVWACAAGVMIYGIPIVYDLVTAHDAPSSTAWLLSLCADLALAVGLVATPVLARHQQKAGWVGTLRWISGGVILCLQVAEPLTKPGGPDWVGVVTHVVGPILLFAVIEAAAGFQRKMGAVIAIKERELAAMEKVDADNRGELTRLRRQLVEAQQLQQQAEKEAAKELERVILEARREAEYAAAEIARLTDQLTSGGALREQEVGSVTARAEFAEATVADLRRQIVSQRVTHDSAVRSLREAHEDDLRRLAEEQKAALRKVREEYAEALAEVNLPHLEDRRRAASKRSTKAAPEAPSRPRLSDDQVLELLFKHAKEVLEDDGHQWSQQEIVDVARVGWSRAPRLWEALPEHLRRRPSETPVETSEVSG